MNTERQVWRDRVLLDASGELTESGQQALRRQLARDQELRAFAATVAAVAADAGSLLPDGQPRAETLAAIEQSAREACGKGRVVRFPAPLLRWRPLLAVAASLLMVVSVWIALQAGQRHPVEQAGAIDGVATLGNLLAVVTDSAASTDAEPVSAAVTLDDLATQLLQIQGFADDDGTVDEAAILFPEPDPTAIRGRSIDAVPAGRCV